MIEMEIFGGTAPDALTTITFPDLEFHPGWDYTPNRWVTWNRRSKVLLPLDGGQFELEHLSSIAFLTPGINKMEHAVVRPNALFDLLVDANPFWRACSVLGHLSGCGELPILRRAT